jgi:putative heme-binding domain-containing protein
MNIPMPLNETSRRKSAATLFSLIFCFIAAGAAEPDSIVHMLVPGFTVQELPLHLSNINNIRFAPDGRLFALGYDGRIHILHDSDGDGLEDTDELFWDKPTISVPVGMAIVAESGTSVNSTHPINQFNYSVYVSSHGKVSILRDTDGDGKADREEVIATGWPPTDVASGGVDATGVTLDREGNIYFGLIAADYSNPYRVKDGVSHYELNAQRGTIQKLSKDGKRRETIANGIRVPFALAFNKAGDLFCTDQEGETWCPNGNPLDELNHIIPGRNYGFPPRDEKWLPDLQSEPPVVAFGPQHQSTCGLVFNEPRKGQGLFGPKWWQGDAFIAGESRGKIWRVRLVKTPHGYFGKEFIIARLSMLTLDLAISPQGSLYVCCHSGKPDWGTGPKGEGKIFKISYTHPDAPQPVFACAAGPMEVRVTFDKPIDPVVTNAVLGQKIEFGEYVRAADRFEVLKPPYKVVNQQEATPRGKLNIIRAKLENRRTLILSTDPHPQLVTYALAIPEVKAVGSKKPGATVDLDYEPGGGVWTDPNRAALLRNLPHGGEIVASLRQKPWLEVSKSTPYPFIHSELAAPDKSVAVAGGDFERGRSLFFGERLKCSTCHRIRGEGATVGPDLSNLVSRDADSVLRDIKEPSASINPDYVAYNITLKPGAELITGADITGFIRAQDEKVLRLIGADGKEMFFKRSDIAKMQPSSVSLMPAGLLDAVKENEIRDLLTFLLNAPPIRSDAEISKALDSSIPHSALRTPHLSLVLVASKQDHGPGQHDYPAWQKTWHALLEQATNVAVSDAWLWPTPEQFQTANVLVFYYWNRDWNAEKFQQLDSFIGRGGGLVILHSATIGDPDPQQLAERIGLASDSHKTKYLHTPIDLRLVAPADHPITRGLPARIHFVDEPYWPMIGDTNKIEILAAVDLEERTWPTMWTFTKGQGRVFASIFGHYTWTLDDPLFRIIVLRGIAWAGGEEVDRLLPLLADPKIRNPKAEARKKPE